MPIDDDVDALARHADVASERVGTSYTSFVPDMDPSDLVLTLDHPGSAIRRVVDLLQIVGSVYVQVGGIRVHLFADVAGRRCGTVRGLAKVLVVLEQNLSLEPVMK